MEHYTPNRTPYHCLNSALADACLHKALRAAKVAHHPDRLLQALHQAQRAADDKRQQLAEAQRQAAGVAGDGGSQAGVQQGAHGLSEAAGRGGQAAGLGGSGSGAQEEEGAGAAGRGDATMRDVVLEALRSSSGSKQPAASRGAAGGAGDGRAGQGSSGSGARSWSQDDGAPAAKRCRSDATAPDHHGGPAGPASQQQGQAAQAAWAAAAGRVQALGAVRTLQRELREAQEAERKALADLVLKEEVSKLLNAWSASR